MAFVIKKTGKITTENITWKFSDLNNEFVSTAERLERNIAYWRNKTGNTSEVIYINVKKEEENEPIIPNTDWSIYVDDCDEPNNESNIQQVIEVTVDNIKRKSRKSTPKL